MLFSLFYNISLLLYFLLSAPYLLIRSIKNPKYGLSLIKKFGFSLHNASLGKKIIWVHAVSLGETRGAQTLVKLLKEKFQNSLIVFTTTTVTGQEEAKKNIKADFFGYLPWDLSFIIFPLVKRVNPSLVLLIESDFWPNFLAACKKNKANIVLVNGKISEKSLNRLLKFPSIKEKIINRIDCFCLQSEDYKKRFLALGVKENKIHVTGNIKLDLSVDENVDAALIQKLSLAEDDFVLVFGSSHFNEEDQFTGVLNEIWKKHPHVKAVLVPRHPERFNEVADRLKKNQVDFLRYSEIGEGRHKKKLILLDQMGLLMKCYRHAHAAVVGGSFIKSVGGHNILEPCSFGIPVVFGPYMHSQPELVRLAKEYNVGYQVDMKNLSNCLSELIANNNLRTHLGENGRKLIQDSSGSSFRTLKIIENSLEKGVF
ncbi:3-deoxy-D-manno-octulosonic acid transferase [Criblamydia sequanensis]|uniref:3-deoxy-D-manno-octulosonic acid transferase n=1 Tax=Candidatus Criblamydia sequanensis CRIB-18 TaxID=1437425 RepID=A0A090DXV3_9BACT|nr:3-deoxy-D-manno-octulosonic acid transferase [Criblamydia sequanensis]CDR33609.1 3-deoxy-D-manno-octulosonic-acid transferase [Criblamydia sequanensis CRIB-18]